MTTPTHAPTHTTNRRAASWPQEGAPASAGPPGHTRAILAIILVSYFLILLDNSVVFTGVPSIRADLNLPQTQLSWVQDAYTLVFGGLLLLGARLGDLLGRRRVFIAGLLVFVLASALVGSAPNGTWLVVARAIQGIGAAIVAPSSLSLLTASFPEGPARARAVAMYGATAGIGASLGLVVGGAAADLVSWRAGFFINLPIVIAMVLLAPKYLPETETRTGAFDLPGAILATLGTGALAFSVIDSADHGWTTPTVLLSLAAGVVLLALLVLRERGAPQPIISVRCLASRAGRVPVSRRRSLHS
ncbi:MFS transporter [Terrabacter carboxydivorans]|uniref:Major facilitator superfamily (MFS) profile domain-containing protein n=1 Tax=Terrabacter carboxydivorans TaxID=619730 RepID=A0ABP5ZFQ3_9MICO